MKAISPLVASALLLIITVAGGLIIYNYMINALKAPQEYAALSVVSAKMLVGDTYTVINVKVANIGTAPATITQAEILSNNSLAVGGPISISNIKVEPGTTKSFNIELDYPLGTTNQYYLVLVYDGGKTEPIPIQVIK